MVPVMQSSLFKRQIPREIIMKIGFFAVGIGHLSGPTW